MNIFSYLRNSFLTFFGNIKVYKTPFFMLYDPGSYKIKGNEVRKIIGVLRKGDILIRGYSNYLDGYFIPGFFSHAGLYLGETQKPDEVMPEVIENQFYEGEQTVIHSMARGVFMEDILSFCRCDYLVVLRRNEKTEKDYGETLGYNEVYTNAMRHLGKDYDFKFDFSDIGSLSCTELVYVCNEKVMPAYNVKLKKRRVLFFKKVMLVPDDFITEEFEIVFKSRTVKESIITKIINYNKKNHA